MSAKRKRSKGDDAQQQPPRQREFGGSASGPDAFSNPSKEEIERLLREANNAVEGAEAQLRALLSELGQSAEEMQELLDGIKANPSDFKQDPGRAKKALAEAMLQKMRVENTLRTQEEAEARSLRAVERGTKEAALFAKYVQQAELVKLNVGGEIFTTSKSAMLAADEGSLLEVLYSGRQGTPPSPLFLDRDPALFVHVIRFLRAAGAGQANIGPSTLMIPTAITAAAVLEEARFFGLSRLEGIVEKVILEFGREEFQKVVTKLSGAKERTEAVVYIMNKYSDSAVLQEEGCRALECLAYDNTRVQVVSAGGIKAVLDGMKKHRGSAKLQERGCLALWHLGQNEANKVTIMIAQARMEEFTWWCWTA